MVLQLLTETYDTINRGIGKLITVVCHVTLNGGSMAEWLVCLTGNWWIICQM